MIVTGGLAALVLGLMLAIAIVGRTIVSEDAELDLWSLFQIALAVALVVTGLQAGLGL